MKNLKMAITGFVLLLPAFAAAQDYATSESEEVSAEQSTKSGRSKESSCKDDAAKLCAGIEGAEMAKCLMDNESALSPSCRQRLAKLKKDNPCAPYAGKLCKDTAGSPMAQMQCLLKHEADLSDDCRRALESIRKSSGKGPPCAADTKKFCKGVKGGPGEVKKCLREHSAELSQACKKKISQGGKREKKSTEAADQQ